MHSIRFWLKIGSSFLVYADLPVPPPRLRLTPSQPQFLRDILGLVAGYGLLTVTGDEHKQLRRAMNPAFSISNLTARASLFSLFLLAAHIRRDGHVLRVY